MSGNDRVINYSSTLPVPQATLAAWLANDVQRVRVVFASSVAEMLWASGMDEWNDNVDEQIGVVLSDLHYGVDREKTEDFWRENPVEDDTVYLYVEGEVCWDFYEDEDWYIGQ